MLHKEAWVAKFLGTHLSIQVHKRVKFSWRANSPLALKRLIMVLILEQWRKIIPSLYSKIEVVNFTKIEIYNPSALKYYSQFVNIYQFHYLKYNHVKGGSIQEDSNTTQSDLSLERHFRDYFLLHRGDIATWATLSGSALDLPGIYLHLLRKVIRNPCYMFVKQKHDFDRNDIFV